MLRNGARGYEGPVIKFVDISGVQTMAELGEGESPVCSLPVEGDDDGAVVLRDAEGGRRRERAEVLWYGA